MVQGFCPLNIKITQFPGGFLVNISVIIVSNVHCTDRAGAIICFAFRHYTYVRVMKMGLLTVSGKPV